MFISGAGKTFYKEFKPFTAHELRQHFGLYIMHGLNPSPRVEMKFKPQRVDAIHGNDYCYHNFGPNAERRHQNFKAFLTTQDPLIQPPERKKYPNWKVRPLIKWINYLMPMVWLLGRAFSIDEMTMGFKGKHQDKRRITYKAEGDGFQADALCQEGFCFQVHMRNDPAPRKYLKQGLSPLHSRVMYLFDSLKDDHHHCAMDNLYNSAAFCRAAVNHPRRVLCHGVARKGNRGIPKMVQQDLVESRIGQLAVRGTVKAAVVEGDDKIKDLIASSVYDTKPVHYLSMVCEAIKWIIMKKDVFNVDTDTVEELQFLRMAHIDTYNNEMGQVDIADQLRGSYRCDWWLRNRKWWWSLLFWVFGLLLTNTYITMCKIHLSHGVEKKISCPNIISGKPLH